MIRIFIPYINRFLKSLWRGLIAFLKPVAGALIFILLAALELADWTGLLSRYGNPEKEAVALGITTQASATHLLVMIVLSISIALMALFTVVGLFQASRWIIVTARLTGGLFGVYGTYQIISGLMVAARGKEGLVLAGSAFILIGAAVFVLGGKFVHSIQQTRQVSH